MRVSLREGVKKTEYLVTQGDGGMQGGGQRNAQRGNGETHMGGWTNTQWWGGGGGEMQGGTENHTVGEWRNSHGGGVEKQTGGTEKHTHFLYRITDSWAFYLRLHNYTNNRFCP